MPRSGARCPFGLVRTVWQVLRRLGRTERHLRPARRYALVVAGLPGTLTPLPVVTFHLLTHAVGFPGLRVP